MQIMFNPTTGGGIAAGAGFTSASCVILPSWAPPIDWIGTTYPWRAMYWQADSTTPKGRQVARAYHVRSYGRRSTLHAGQEVVSCDRATNGGTKQGASARVPMFLLTYRAVGELTRP